MTFQIGDRVTSSLAEGVFTFDKVYRHQGSEPHQWVETINVGTDDAPLFVLTSSLELYAKAGEFVKGDVVIPANTAGGPWTVLDVQARDDGQRICFPGEYGQWWRADAYRLATPEEVAAAEGSKVTPKPFGPFFNILGEPDTRATASHISTASPTTRSEIPAADFDFDRIKRGDVVVVHRTVDRDGLTHIGNVSVDPIGGFIKPSRIHSVIPSPKPKTLRERAIEAAKGVEFDGAYVGNMSALKAAVVDLVLAEVEKGQ